MRARLESYLRDWRKLLRGHVYQAQQVLRRLVKGRLTFTPTADGHYKFCGVGTVQPVLAGVVQNLASLMPASWNQIVGWLQRMDELRRAA